MCAANGLPNIANMAVYDSQEEFSDDSDPEYIDSDATEDDELWLGNAPNRVIDRCRYIRMHRPVLLELHEMLLDVGREALGNAFLQECSPERFYNFCYCNTTANFPNTEQ